MRNTWRVMTIFAALSIGGLLVDTPAAWAQSMPVDPGRRPPETTVTPERTNPRTPERNHPAPPNPALRFLLSEMTVVGKIVKHTPYSAETLTEGSQTLSNGAKLTRQSSGMIYRDSEGRTRRELSAVLAGPFAASGDRQRVFFINDPVAGISWTIIPDSDTTRTRTLPAGNSEAPPEPESFSGTGRTESIGTQMIEGFEAQGSRTTILIPVGAIGNDKPLEITHERWYSPELQTILLSKHSDPRWGETVYKLFHITRGEPDHSLFTLPAPSSGPGKKTRPKP